MIGLNISMYIPTLNKLIFSSSTGLITVENETRCYEELGCVNITRSWYHLIHRPFNVFPLPREVINTRFILYTKKNPTEVNLHFDSPDFRTDSFYFHLTSEHPSRHIPSFSNLHSYMILSYFYFFFRVRYWSQLKTNRLNGPTLTRSVKLSSLFTAS